MDKKKTSNQGDEKGSGGYMIRWLGAGESHGKGISVIIDGLPAGIAIDVEAINRELSRRQMGYGRGRRMKIENDRVLIFSGIRHGKTLGSPVQLLVINRDYKNWTEVMEIGPGGSGMRITKPRPGHGDLAGYLKYGFDDIRNVLERASARTTVSWVAGGAIFKQFLANFGITIYSHTLRIGRIQAKKVDQDITELDNTPLRCLDSQKEKQMMELIDQAQRRGDSVGGVCEVIAQGVCAGLGTYAQFDRRLDARIGQVMFSIPSVKGVEIGSGFDSAQRFGSEVQDQIYYKKARGFYRRTNRAGGIEAGVSNGEDIIVRLWCKPIPTLRQPLNSVDIETKSPVLAQKERADVCVVPAVGVIGEAMLAYVIADAFLEKFGSDTMRDIQANFAAYLRRLNEAG